MNLVLTPKFVPDAVLFAFKAINPEPDTTKWTKSNQLGFIRGPLESVRRAGYTAHGEFKDSVVVKIGTDTVNRGLSGYAPDNIELIDPDFNPLAKNARGYNTWDWQHFTIAARRDLALDGGFNDAVIALQFVTSYFNNEKVPYLRCGDDAAGPAAWYGTGGKLRTAARIVIALCHALDILEFGGHRDTPQFKFAFDLLLKHVARIKKALPLAAAPKGDHLPVPHVEVFMLGHLWEAMEIAKERLAKDANETAWAAANHVGVFCSSIIEFAHLPQFGPATFAYDVAMSASGGPYIHDLTLEPETGDDEHDKIVRGRRPTGLLSVNQWIAPALRGREPFDLLRAHAIADGVHQKHPWLWVDRMQEPLPG